MLDTCNHINYELKLTFNENYISILFSRPAASIDLQTPVCSHVLAGLQRLLALCN